MVKAEGELSTKKQGVLFIIKFGPSLYAAAVPFFQKANGVSCATAELPVNSAHKQVSLRVKDDDFLQGGQ